MIFGAIFENIYLCKVFSNEKKKFNSKICGCHVCFGGIYRLQERKTYRT